MAPREPVERRQPFRVRAGRTGAFTIIELMIALGVLAILASLGQSLYGGYRERALAGQAVADIQAISSRIERSRIEFGQYPASIDRAMNPLPLDPWGNAYQYLRIAGANNPGNGALRKDKNLVPLNSDYDLYSMGPDGASQPPLTAKASHDDIVRASNGGFVGRATDF